MSEIDTQAWVLRAGPAPTAGEPRQAPRYGDAELPSDAFTLEPYSFPAPMEDECLLEPLFGCWEANYAHALRREPVDVCRQRGEGRIVLGNCGVVRVLQAGSDVSNVKEGDVCLLHGAAVVDKRGHMVKAHAYDAPGTIGILAKRTKAPARQLIPLPQDNPFTLEQWAAFSLRYVTAWSNWRSLFAGECSHRIGRLG